MNHGLLKARQSYLLSLIKKVSYGHGETDENLIQQHYDEIIRLHFDESIEHAIKCYEDMVERLIYYRERNNEEKKTIG